MSHGGLKKTTAETRSASEHHRPFTIRMIYQYATFSLVLCVSR